MYIEAKSYGICLSLSFNIASSRSAHVFTNGKISFFFMALVNLLVYYFVSKIFKKLNALGKLPFKLNLFNGYSLVKLLKSLWVPAVKS